ncbi:MAG: hypothetical protein JWQ61_2861 [Collimonas fungivorans]|uniref:hypothetical protein n=1 Tax=Collimonas fungivorans TaxID=158899 RepID=UPI0026F1AD0F|nr:hypothetical protein [Collimonas fungivorans]MDB5768047.1 hypothetical protein [Collimonas fungivorans]
MSLSKVRAVFAHVLKKVIDFLLSSLRQLPLVGGLADCTGRDHKLAVREFFLALVFSTTTFWITVVIMSVLVVYSSTSTFDLILKTVSNGELLIFSVSFAAPILLVAAQDRSGKVPFPGAIWHVVALWVFAIVAAIISGLLKVQTVAPNINLGLNMGAVKSMSYYVFAVALFLRYTTVVYQKMLATADASGPKQDKVFADRWVAHAENKGQ